MFERCKGILIPAVTTAVFLCTVPGNASADPLQVAVSRTPLSLPFFVAESRGLLSGDAGEIRLQECLGGHRCMQKVLSGDADAGTASDLVITTQALKRADFAVLATFVTSDEDTQLIANQDADITSSNDLRGKNVAYTPGTSGHYFLDTFLLLKGIPPSEVRSVAVQPEDMAAALADGVAAAVATWQPWSQRALEGVDNAFVLDSTDVYTLTFNLVVRGDVVAGKEEQLKQLIRALHESQAFIEKDPDSAKEILSTRLEMSREAVDHAWPTLDYRLSLAQSLLVTLESEANWARRTGVIETENNVNFLDYVNPKLLREVVPDSVTIVH